MACVERGPAQAVVDVSVTSQLLTRRLSVQGEGARKSTNRSQALSRSDVASAQQPRLQTADTRPLAHQRQQRGGWRGWRGWRGATKKCVWVVRVIGALLLCCSAGPRRTTYSARSGTQAPRSGIQSRLDSRSGSRRTHATERTNNDSSGTTIRRQVRGRCAPSSSAGVACFCGGAFPCSRREGASGRERSRSTEGGTHRERLRCLAAPLARCPLAAPSPSRLPPRSPRPQHHS